MTEVTVKLNICNFLSTQYWHLEGRWTIRSNRIIQWLSR